MSSTIISVRTTKGPSSSIHGYRSGRAATWELSTIILTGEHELRGATRIVQTMVGPRSESLFRDNALMWIPYPVVDFAASWERILRSYIVAMTWLRDALSHKHGRRSGKPSKAKTTRSAKKKFEKRVAKRQRKAELRYLIRDKIQCSDQRR
jgi:hypothetical protein